MDFRPEAFAKISSAEQLERAQWFRDGGLSDANAIARREASQVNFFQTASRPPRTILDDEHFARLMRDWGR